VRTACFCFFAAVAVGLAGTLPLTTIELSLMLRSGYTLATIEAELTTRHFADQLDETQRKQLIKAGATTELLDAIQSGKFAIPKDELENSRRKMEQQEHEHELMAEQAKKNDAVYEKQLLRQRSRTLTKGTDTIADSTRGNLVCFKNGNVVSFDESDLSQKKIYGLYFSAHWCAPCRKFTPRLVDYYKQVERDHPEFEIIFISNDKSADAMATYMQESNMPWPAIEYDKLANLPSLQKYAGKGIPDLVIVGASGKVLADSFVAGKYIGPAKVLDALSAILMRTNSSTQVAANR
jgi:nucleoredoxin